MEATVNGVILQIDKICATLNIGCRWCFYGVVIYTPRCYMVQGKELNLEAEAKVKNTCSLKKMFQSTALITGEGQILCDLHPTLATPAQPNWSHPSDVSCASLNQARNPLL